MSSVVEYHYELTRKKKNAVVGVYITKEEEGLDMDEGEDSKVAIGAERVYNLGNYESIRVSVNITTSCTKEDIPTTVKSLSIKLPGRLTKIYDLFRESMAND